MAKVVAMDWDDNNEVITCHLKYSNGKVVKRYLDDDYGDDIYIMQYICSDKSGNEIYEGDIVDTVGNGNTKDYEIVETKEDLMNEWTKEKYAQRGTKKGNIYENMDLID